jgi:AcrR family transcriptional regulator
MTENNTIWIKTGYEMFAHGGLSGLKIETLAKKVGISKSSFYHHFADMELFVEQLLQYHIQQSVVIGEKEQQAVHIDPDLIDILVAHKTDLLFNRQLRIHRNNPLFAETLLKSDAAVGNGFVLIWVKDLGLQLQPKQLEAIFELALENFFLQMNAENLNHAWLSNYFNHLKTIARKFV